MHAESSIAFSSIRPKDGVLALSGYGIRVAVERGHLVVEDGRGDERRQARFSRTSRELKRLVILGHSGSISFDALRWLYDRGCSFSQLDTDGIVLMASGPPGLDDAGLRRAQAIAGTSESGLEIAKRLIRAKLIGQATVAQSIDSCELHPSEIRELALSIDLTPNIERLRVIESQAAAIYWACWSSVAVRFARRISVRLPIHWHTFGTRTSPLTQSPRVAANPANAILNYLYAILEAESRLALLAVGLDPGMGVMHADLRARDSLACDVMEAVRPSVDAYALELLRSRVFGSGDFFETREGACRLLPPITRTLAESALSWAKLIAPVVEDVARQMRMSARSERLSREMTTPLTMTNRSVGRDRVRERRDAESGQSKQDRRDTPSVPPSLQVPAIGLRPACHFCGVLLDTPGRSYCPDCLPDIQQEHGGDYARIGLETLAQQRAQGIDPAHGGAAAARRAVRLAANQAAIAEWEADAARRGNASDQREPEWFVGELLPLLQGVSIDAIARATGLSAGYCSFVRRGLRTPHPRHWEALNELARKKGEIADRS